MIEADVKSEIRGAAFMPLMRAIAKSYTDRPLLSSLPFTPQQSNPKDLVWVQLVCLWLITPSASQTVIIITAVLINSISYLWSGNSRA